MGKSTLLKVFFAILLAGVAGYFTNADSVILGIPLLELYDLIGQLFLNALTLVVVPLVAASIITGTARMSAERDFAPLGLKTFGYYIGTTTIAVLIGWGAAILFQPGSSQGDLSHLISSSDQIAQYATLAQSSHGGTFYRIGQILLKLVPSNILAVASQGQMLGLIFFSLLFGFFIPKVEATPGAALLGFWKGMFQVMMKMTHLVMHALPIGVFGLVAKVIATTGFDAVRSVGYFFMSVLIGLAIYSFIALPILLRFVAGVSPIRHFRAMAPALFTAFSTSSTAATLPITIDCVEKRANISNRICSFVIPLAASLNMSGTALYSCLSTFFICQIYGVELGFDTQLLIVLLSLLTSFGMAGIPSASIVSIIVILNTIGVPADGIALVLVVERLLDMCRTTTNVLGNTCCAVLVARSEGERDVLAAG
ncbi:MAG: dicarboxylate/amino acid:cation symporter [Chlamydiales bacterium]|nr:dicarboxylate/amino acid:cation symporter [Chlamydiia bacterium]MCP5507071.1 dicarboxylate/amino acid:cation symporter [Chlamydiales bacterium]